MMKRLVAHRDDLYKAVANGGQALTRKELKKMVKDELEWFNKLKFEL